MVSMRLHFRNRFLPTITTSLCAMGVLFTLVSGCGRSRNSGGTEVHGVPKMEAFILPAGYRGPVIAIYGQGEGTLPEWRGDTAVYRVPQGGIVRTQLQEPPPSTYALHSFSDAPQAWLDNSAICARMRIKVADDRPRVCWLDYSRGGTGIPDHIVAVVTDWNGIPEQYNRTSFAYDSVLFGGGKAHLFIWTEPTELQKKRAQRRVQ